MDTNHAVVFPAHRQVVIEERPMPAPGPGELLIGTTCSLISTGTELTVLSGNYPPTSDWSTYTFPSIPGYNNIGVVVEVGEDVDESWIGKKVATYSMHKKYVTWPASDARPVHRAIADDHAAFFTIAEIVMNGIRRSGLQWGESVIVYGAGLLGQLAVRFCRLAGARPVLAVDVAASRLQRLPKDTQVVPVDASGHDVAAVVKETTQERMADICFEITGNPKAIPEQVPLLHEQGRLILLSSPSGPTESFDFLNLCNSPSVSIIGAHNWSHPPVETWQNPWTMHRHCALFFDLIADGEMDIEPLISHREPYAAAPKLYDMLLQDRSQAMGVILHW